MIVEDVDFDLTKFAIPIEQIELDSTNDLPKTPLLQAVVEGKTDMVIELAKVGYGTTSLDNTNHVLNYVRNFGGDKKVEMAKALVAAKVVFSNEKAEQALVSSLYPNIDAKFVDVIVCKDGVVTEGALKLFINNNLLPQIECLIMSGAEVTEDLAKIAESQGIIKEIQKYIDAKQTADVELESFKPMTGKEKLQFILMKVAEGISDESEILEAYKRSDALGKQYVDAFIRFVECRDNRPTTFLGLCKIYKVELPQAKGDVSGLLTTSTHDHIQSEENSNTTSLLGEDADI